MSNNLQFTLKFDAETRQFVGQVQGAGQAVGSLGHQAQATSGKMQGMARQSDAIEGQMLGLRNQLLGVAAGFSAVAAAQQATDRLGAYQDIRTQITSLVGGQQQWLQTEQYLIEVSKDHNKALLGMAGNYARVASIEDAGMITRQQTIALFEGMSNAASTYGATNEQLGQSMFGLQQAMASQTVRAEELNQTTEPLPGLLARMDKAAGLASGGFRKLVNNGQVTSDFFAETLVKALASYEGAAARTAGNVNALYGDLSTVYTQLVVAYEQPISDSFSPLVITLTQSLELLADNAELVTTAVGVTMALAIGRGTAAMVNMTAAKAKDVLATRAHHVEQIKQAQATIAVTSAEIARLETLQTTNAFIFRSTGGEKALAVARGQLAMATNQLAVSQARTNIALRAGNGLMALAGGPVGLVMMAAGAVAYWAATNREAATDTQALADKVDSLLGRMDALQAKRLQSAIDQQKRYLTELENEYRQVALAPKAGVAWWDRMLLSSGEIRDKQREASSAYAREVSTIESAMEKATADLLALEKKLAEVKAGKTSASSSKTPPSLGLDDGDEQAKKQLALMKRQLALYGEKSELAKVTYELEHGALKSINDGLKQQLQLEAKKLDNRAAEAETLERTRALNKEGNDQLAQLRQQAALHGTTSEAARLRYDIEYGALKGINEELAKNLLLEAEKLDKLNANEPCNNKAIESFYAETDALNEGWMMRLAIMADRENEAKIREEYAYNERLQRMSESFQAAYAQAQENQQLQDELEREYFANREILRADHEANLTDINRKAEDERQAYQAQVAQSTLNFTQQQLSITTNFLKQAGEEQSGLYRVLFAAQKLAAIPSMIVATEEAATKALSFGPPPVGMALSTAVRTMGYASVGIVAGQALAGQAHDGIWRVPAENEGTWMLKKNEMVLNTRQAEDFRWMVTVMQQMKAMQSQQLQQQAVAGGGHPNINVAAPPVHVAFLDNQEQLNAYLRSDAGEQAIVKIVKRNRSAL